MDRKEKYIKDDRSKCHSDSEDYYVDISAMQESS